MASEWIPVSERLPEDDQEVIVAWPGGVNTGLYSQRAPHWHYYYAESEVEFPGVTHWMPLPDPPEPATPKCAAEMLERAKGGE